MIIKDGKTGIVAKVNGSNELKVLSNSTNYEFNESFKNGNCFTVATPLLTITTTPGLMYYVRNDGTKKIALTDLKFYWNGGSTNFNRPAYVILSKDFSVAPTTNNTVSAAGNLNFTSTNPSSLVINYWDETGTGMTGQSGDTMFSFPICTQGLTSIDLAGVAIIGPGASLGVYAYGSEVGEWSFNARFIESDFTSLIE